MTQVERFQMAMVRSRASGFTLIEVMVVLAIVAILAAIVTPTYKEHIAKGRRGEAMSSLMEGAQALERYYSANGSYLKGANLATVFPTNVPATGTAYYNIAATLEAANTFTLRATRVGVMANDECGDFEITQSGARQLNGNTKAMEQCWRR